jgi:hypothetical protein
MFASQRLFLKIHQAIAEKAGGDLVGYSVYRALRMEATQIASTLDSPHETHAEIFARMHSGKRTIAATRRMFQRALAAREGLRDDYQVTVDINSRGVTEPPIVTAINLWDTDPLNKIRIKLCT